MKYNFRLLSVVLCLLVCFAACTKTELTSVNTEWTKLETEQVSASTDSDKNKTVKDNNFKWDATTSNDLIELVDEVSEEDEDWGVPDDVPFVVLFTKNIYWMEDSIGFVYFPNPNYTGSLGDPISFLWVANDNNVTGTGTTTSATSPKALSFSPTSTEGTTSTESIVGSDYISNLEHIFLPAVEGHSFDLRFDVFYDGGGGKSLIPNSINIDICIDISNEGLVIPGCSAQVSASILETIGSGAFAGFLLP